MSVRPKISYNKKKKKHRVTSQKVHTLKWLTKRSPASSGCGGGADVVAAVDDDAELGFEGV